MKRVIFAVLLIIFFLALFPSCKKYGNEVGIRLKIINSSSYPIYDIHIKGGLSRNLKTIESTQTFGFNVTVEKNKQVEIIYKNHLNKEKEIKTDYSTKILTSSPADIVIEIKDHNDVKIKHIDNSFDGINKKLEENS